MILFRPANTGKINEINKKVNGEVNGGVNGGINPILEYIKINPGLRLPAISQGLEMPDKTVEKKIKALKQDGKIEYRGSKKTGGYYAK